jgi:hypothetical protein
MAAYVDVVMNRLLYNREFLDHHIVSSGRAVGTLLSQLLSKR